MDTPEPAEADVRQERDAGPPSYFADRVFDDAAQFFRILLIRLATDGETRLQ